MNSENSQLSTSPAEPKGTIMIVDDDIVAFKMFEEYFDSKGYKCISVQDPRTTPKHINSGRPDIIIVEINMDKISGDNLIKSLRKGGLKTPIIVISTRIDKKLIVGLKNYDISDFFIKPVAFDKLYTKIRSVLAVRKKDSSPKSSTAAVVKKPQMQHSLLLLSEDENIIKTPQTFIPRKIIDKYGFKIISRTDCHDAIDALKNPANRIRMIMVDASNEARTRMMVGLLKIITAKFKIPVIFVADSFSQSLINYLNQNGFDNFISRADSSTKSLIDGIDSNIANAQTDVNSQALKHRHQIIRDLKAIKSLPPLPDIYLKVEKLAQNPNTTSAQYGQVLELDPGITARLLRMSNSAHFSFKREIKTVKNAVALMGTREILSMVRLACITGNLKATPEIESAVKKVWVHSATCAVAARLIYENTDICKIPKLGDDLFICGIIHDIGKILLWKFFSKIYLSFILSSGRSGFQSIADEKKSLGTTHCEVGKFLAGHWQFPESLTDVIANHHDPMQNPDSELVMMIHISDYVCHIISDDIPEKNGYNINSQLLEKIGYTSDRLHKLASDLKSDIGKKADIATQMITG